MCDDINGVEKKLVTQQIKVRIQWIKYIVTAI